MVVPTWTLNEQFSESSLVTREIEIDCMEIKKEEEDDPSNNYLSSDFSMQSNYFFEK